MSTRHDEASPSRAPVQGDSWLAKSDPHRGPGTIAWAEHIEAWRRYSARFPGQSAERIAERGGFGYRELQLFLGRDPETWEPLEVSQ